MVKRIALVACNGGCRNDSCGYGCIGCAACVSVCPADAIVLNDCGVAGAFHGAHAAGEAQAFVDRG